MRFQLVDRIVEVEPGRRLRAVKQLTLGEEYLADHFPSFPVMPGVLMLHALVEAAAWLLRATDEFRYSVVTLREARAVKFGSFMEPGKRMEIAVELLEHGEGTAKLKGTGEADGQTSVSARLTVACYNLRDHDPGLAAIDERLVRHLREQFAQLYPAVRTPL
jgi:3-hydroxyacyl-[acyl-carrier-protein] dehydratase